MYMYGFCIDSRGQKTPEERICGIVMNQTRIRHATSLSISEEMTKPSDLKEEIN